MLNKTDDVRSFLQLLLQNGILDFGQHVSTEHSLYASQLTDVCEFDTTTYPYAVELVGRGRQGPPVRRTLRSAGGVMRVLPLQFDTQDVMLHRVRFLEDTGPDAWWHICALRIRNPKADSGCDIAFSFRAQAAQVTIEEMVWSGWSAIKLREYGSRYFSASREWDGSDEQRDLSLAFKEPLELLVQEFVLTNLFTLEGFEL